MRRIIKFPIPVILDKASESNPGVTPILQNPVREYGSALESAVASEKAVSDAINAINIPVSGSNIGYGFEVFTDTVSATSGKRINYNSISGGGVIFVTTDENNIYLNTTQIGAPTTSGMGAYRHINGGVEQESSLITSTTLQETSAISCFHNVNAGDIIGKIMIKCSEGFDNVSTQYSIGTDNNKEGFVKKFNAPINAGRLINVKYGDYLYDKTEISEISDSNTGVNYWGDGSDGDLVITSNTTWDSTYAGDMIVKNFRHLTINAGCTLQIYARKGCLIYVKGNFTNYGTINIMSRYSANPYSEGVAANGIQFVRFKTGSTSTQSGSVLLGCGSAAITAESNQKGINGNGKIYTIPRIGANGAPAAYSTGDIGAYVNGSNGGVLQTGGGGSGGAYTECYAGAGGSGTCWSGGAGGGGIIYSGTATAGSSIGGSGGNGAYADDHWYGAGGGAGNPGGYGQKGGNNGTYGIGGTMMIFAKNNFLNYGSLVACGYQGGNAYTYDSDYGNSGAGGGGSGGGVILGLYGGTYVNASYNVSGGSGGGAYVIRGGNGGNGYALFEQILK